VISTDNGRSLYIDTYRGLACVLLVAYHTIGEPVTGLRLPHDSFWHVFGDGLIYFRMPMFAFLSGVVYGWRPFTGDRTNFLTGKMRRLLLPMLVVGTAFAVLRSTMPGVNIPWQHWSTLHIIPDAQYWFSESLFLIFLSVMILESLSLLGDSLKFAIVLAIAAIAHLIISLPQLLGLKGANYLFPFFLCGLGCSRFQIAKPRFLPIYSSILLFTSSYAIAGILGYVPESDRISVVALLLGVSCCFTLFVSGWKNRTLAAIGCYSFSIYLKSDEFSAVFSRSWRGADGRRSIAR
jgi:fucose 4-O-acetylase-like acetyltransferase